MSTFSYWMLEVFLFFNKQIIRVGSEKGGKIRMSKNTNLKPGQIAPASGQYEIVRNGRPTKVERTAIINKPLPPAPKSGDRYRLVDRTKH